MKNDIEVPLLDLVMPHAELDGELVGVFRQSLRGAVFVGGPMVESFESAFAEFCGTSCAVGTGSGTDALRFAIMSCEIAPGEVILTVPNTFIATTEAISQAGAVAEFVDIDEQTYNMSVPALREFLEKQCLRDKRGRLISRRNSRHIAAILPVHLYGQMADMDGILELAEQYDLVVIEDSCQAHGAEYFSKRSNRWVKAGSMGRVAAFSFYPGKNLGGCGEAGAITTNDYAVAEKAKMLRDHGQVRKYFHDLEGYNGRLDALQAGILSVKLPRLSRWNAQRRERAAEYNRLLASVETVKLPWEGEWSRAVYHLYVIQTGDRDEMIRFLKDRSIGTGIHYPIPLHLQNAYKSLNYSKGDFPVAESVASQIISLPMYPHLTLAMQTKVAEEISKFSAGNGTGRSNMYEVELLSAR